MNRLLSLTPLLLALTPACVTPSSSASGGEGPEALLAADRAFAADADADRLEGWMRWFSADAARTELGGKFRQGLEAVRENDEALWANPQLDLRWDPTDAVLFEGGGLGATTGRFELLQLSPDGGETVVGTGGYVSIWRRDAEGWRVILDTGAPDPPQ